MTFDPPRAVRPRDYLAIAELQIESWRSAYRGILPDAYLDDAIVEERREHWQAISRESSSKRFTLVATASTALVGFVTACVGADAGIDATIQNLHVSPRIRGQGLGKRLLAAATERLLQVPAQSVCLWVYDGNVAATRFYQTLGGQADAHGFDDFAGARAPDTRFTWRDIRKLQRACNAS